jgi:hypothetical protein
MTRAANLTLPNLQVAATFWKGGTTFRPSPEHLPSVARTRSEIADTCGVGGLGRLGERLHANSLETRRTLTARLEGL